MGVLSSGGGGQSVNNHRGVQLIPPRTASSASPPGRSVFSVKPEPVVRRPESLRCSGSGRPKQQQRGARLCARAPVAHLTGVSHRFLSLHRPVKPGGAVSVQHRRVQMFDSTVFSAALPTGNHTDTGESTSGEVTLGIMGN